MFIFFGAATGGVFASAGVFILRVGKKYLKRSTLHRYFTFCVVGLTATTVLSCYLNLLYFLHTWDQAYAYFGLAIPFPIIWETFECYLQWRWLLRFYSIEDDLRRGDRMLTTFSDESDHTCQVTDLKREGIPSVFPRGTVSVLRVLVWQWVLLLCYLYFMFIREMYFCWSTPRAQSANQVEAAFNNSAEW
ncbi:hypothetical protein A9Z42_0029750 [Trichoderma parareesei]|uniref:Uncharacterized protein n=1 Tax=Trichoderma parareesei TaxID=858221 RepID=A0A2H2ZC92_TRIPA|nr:hypothetical protein A9Z42_0029750 [Trichoderma parareesei]